MWTRPCSKFLHSNSTTILETGSTIIPYFTVGNIEVQEVK